MCVEFYIVDIASSPGYSQILSPQLQDKIWEWPGDEAIVDNGPLFFCRCLSENEWDYNKAFVAFSLLQVSD